MDGAGRWSRILVVVGLVAMVIGALDPLEGALVILPGTGLVARPTACAILSPRRAAHSEALDRIHRRVA